jgi:hypothetical protein
MFKGSLVAIAEALEHKLARGQDVRAAGGCEPQCDSHGDSVEPGARRTEPAAARGTVLLGPWRPAPAWPSDR